MNTIKVLLVDDQALFREGLGTLLGVHDDIEIIGEAENGEVAIEKAESLRPDVILMDLHMPILNGVEATRRILRTQAGCRIVVLTTFDDDEWIFEGLQAGALGYLLKDASSQQLVEAVRAASRNESVLTPSVAAKVVAQFSKMSRPQTADVNQELLEPLTDREKDILVELGRGSSNKDVAAKFFLAEGTVKNHVSKILAKLDVENRGQAVVKARQLGLI